MGGSEFITLGLYVFRFWLISNLGVNFCVLNWVSCRFLFVPNRKC
jgi:hypothetical protein